MESKIHFFVLFMLVGLAAARPENGGRKTPTDIESKDEESRSAEKGGEEERYFPGGPLHPLPPVPPFVVQPNLFTIDAKLQLLQTRVEQVYQLLTVGCPLPQAVPYPVAQPVPVPGPAVPFPYPVNRPVPVGVPFNRPVGVPVGVGGGVFPFVRSGEDGEEEQGRAANNGGDEEEENEQGGRTDNE